ncbi:hypothetical protein WJS89_02680 [Sphingomicrobium sp. XHP0235]|uniref:hypothetical protein n=1 Tax=Sphingomicrobium aquimarinum TaxID=3133971 RepID=UPI0031FE5D20
MTMNAPKAFASLSGGLLARKGSARPAMRRQNYGQVGSEGLDDLGWNDMGSDPVGTDEDGGNVESITRNPLSGLSPSQPVVHDQQAQLKQQFASDDEDGDDYADDHADLDDSTAELWDPEADESPNVFTGHRDGKKSDALTPPSPGSSADAEDDAVEEESYDVRETSFDTPPVSQSIFSTKAKALPDPVEDDFAEDESAEHEDLDAPQLMRTVADLKPLTDAQKDEGSAWSEDDLEAEASAAEQAAHGLSTSDEEDGDLYGEEEEATAEEEAGEDFDPTASNRFASFITRPAREEEPARPSYDETQFEEQDADEDELLLSAEDVLDDTDESPVSGAGGYETREVSRRDVAEAKAGAKDRAAFTLRLDRERHLKLRLACALTGQSAQKMVTEALDRLLGEMTELDELVEQASVEKR